MINLTTPLGDEVLDLRAGDRVTLSGTIYTARDEAHLRMMEEGIPFAPEGAVVYHCGPVVQEGRLVVAGPTTSARMNALTGFLIDAGVRALIGKGGMGPEVVEQLRGRAVYLAPSTSRSRGGAPRSPPHACVFAASILKTSAWLRRSGSSRPITCR
ncbi:protein of unknown function [Methanoculleus bourgensis]|uniref:Fe-S hydro-lyase tartrate dehydratase beta-type catalytic domain-containing protein n=1 Tax=Methanoculleus bourgensis TaxID=83986 RepID=A0A0X3BLM7_9EURY|nr:protein of unknown function [Methanoculleus bourgensis]